MCSQTNSCSYWVCCSTGNPRVAGQCMYLELCVLAFVILNEHHAFCHSCIWYLDLHQHHRQSSRLVIRQCYIFIRWWRNVRLLSCYNKLIPRRRNQWKRKFCLWRMVLLSYAGFRLIYTGRTIAFSIICLLPIPNVDFIFLWICISGE